jgi:hypothetical protein
MTYFWKFFNTNLNQIVQRFLKIFLKNFLNIFFENVPRIFLKQSLKGAPMAPINPFVASIGSIYSSIFKY